MATTSSGVAGAGTVGTGLGSRHPLYSQFLEDWQLLRDCYDGERRVKAKGFTYLPATSGMVSDGIATANAPGYQAYSAYRTRAHFPDVVSDATDALVGVMHHKPPTLSLIHISEPTRPY